MTKAVVLEYTGWISFSAADQVSSETMQQRFTAPKGMSVVNRTFSYRLYPTSAQDKNLRLVLETARQWYNMCLSERKYAYEVEGRRVGKYDQLALVARYKKTFPQAKQVHSHVLQVATADVDKAFAAFFRRVKAGEKPGYPRFKSRNRFRSFGLKEYSNGFRVDGRRLKLFGIGRVAVRWHRPLDGSIKTVRISLRAGQWYAAFSCDIEPPDPLPATDRSVGVDVGIARLITTSDGEKVAHPAYYRKGQKRLRTLQRQLARAQRGSKNRKKVLLQVQRQHEHVANQRKDFLHKLSHDLVVAFDHIALEDLQIKNMVRNKHLSKSILDSGWSLFRQFLTYKAESAGRVVAVVNPAYTSQRCSQCGYEYPDFDLSIRWVECPRGHSFDRDHNAALNILKRAGWDAPVSANVGPPPSSQEEGESMRPAEATQL